jgi:site-specific DNA-methyltransferase (adenine-specific)
MLITNYYKEQNAQLHRETKWGESGQHSADIVYSAVEILGIKSILDYGVVTRGDSIHPTQKPVALLEYLIRTYTNPGDTVMDNTMGSGTAGVACVQTGRSFVGIEKDAKYFDIAQRRIETAQPALLEVSA